MASVSNDDDNVGTVEVLTSSTEKLQKVVDIMRVMLSSSSSSSSASSCSSNTTAANTGVANDKGSPSSSSCGSSSLYSFETHNNDTATTATGGVANGKGDDRGVNQERRSTVLKAQTARGGGVGGYGNRIFVRNEVPVANSGLLEDDEGVKNDIKIKRRREIVMLIMTETIPQKAWPAAQPFAQWILSHPTVFKGKRVLEIGSGVGIAGFAAARAGASFVALTDCSLVSLAMLEITRREYLRGLLTSSSETSTSCCYPDIIVAELAWGDTSQLAEVLKRLNEVKVRRRKSLYEKGSERPMTGKEEETAIHRREAEVLLDDDPCYHQEHFDIVIGTDVFYFGPSMTRGLQTARDALLGGTGSVPTAAAAMKESNHDAGDDDDDDHDENGCSGRFYCASFARSERMEDELTSDIPATYGFERVGDTKRPLVLPAGCNGGKNDDDDCIGGGFGEEDAERDTVASHHMLFEWKLNVQ